MSDTSKREQTRHAEEAARQATQAFRKAGESAADTIRQGTEAATDSAAHGAETQTDMLSHARQELTEASQKIIDASCSNAQKMRMLITLPQAAEGGLQDMQRCVIGLVESVVRTNLTIMEEMFKVRSPHAYIELQQRFARDYLDGLLDGVTLLVRATRRTADETLRPLEQREATG